MAHKHGIMYFHVIGDFELIVYHVREVYFSKNKMLKQYRNEFLEELPLSTNETTKGKELVPKNLRF